MTLHSLLGGRGWIILVFLPLGREVEIRGVLSGAGRGVCCIELIQPLDGLAGQDDEREDAEKGAEGHEHAKHGGGYDAEESALVAGEIPSGKEGANRGGPSKQDEDGPDADEQVRNESGWRLRVGGLVEKLGVDQHQHAHPDVEKGKAGEKRDDSGNDVVKDRKQPEMLFVKRADGGRYRCIHGMD